MRLKHTPTKEAPTILGICGSPRKQATEHVLAEALNILKQTGFQTQLFTVRGKKIGFCTPCDHCLRHKGECNINDDMQTLYPLLKKADGLIIATPVYDGSMSAQTKTVIDRCRMILAENIHAFRNKPGMAIAVGGDRMGGQELAIQQIHTFYILNGAIPISGGAFGANLGATFWSQDTLAGVKADTEGFRTLKKTTKRFAEFLNKTKH